MFGAEPGVIAGVIPAVVDFLFFAMFTIPLLLGPKLGQKQATTESRAVSRSFVKTFGTLCRSFEIRYWILDLGGSLLPCAARIFRTFCNPPCADFSLTQ